MLNQDWHVDDHSHCTAVGQPDGQLVEPPPHSEAPEREQSPGSAPSGEPPLRLYRFLTYLEDILRATPDNTARLAQIRPLVRDFLNQSPFLLLQCPEPNSEQGWAVTKLYDETDFPLTIQLVSWLPGRTSSIHNHGAWGLVAILDGQECNRFWRCSHWPGPGTKLQDLGSAAGPSPLEPLSEQCLNPGDLITFMPNAIHQIEALGEEPVMSFNLYGETDYSQRFKFDATSGQAKAF